MPNEATVICVVFLVVLAGSVLFTLGWVMGAAHRSQDIEQSFTKLQEMVNALQERLGATEGEVVALKAKKSEDDDDDDPADFWKKGKVGEDEES